MGRFSLLAVAFGEHMALKYLERGLRVRVPRLVKKPLEPRVCAEVSRERDRCLRPATELDIRRLYVLLAAAPVTGVSRRAHPGLNPFVLREYLEGEWGFRFASDVVPEVLRAEKARRKEEGEPDKRLVDELVKAYGLYLRLRIEAEAKKYPELRRFLDDLFSGYLTRRKMRDLGVIGYLSATGAAGLGGYSYGSARRLKPAAVDSVAMYSIARILVKLMGLLVPPWDRRMYRYEIEWVEPDPGALEVYKRALAVVRQDTLGMNRVRRIIMLLDVLRNLDAPEKALRKYVDLGELTPEAARRLAEIARRPYARAALLEALHRDSPPDYVNLLLGLMRDREKGFLPLYEVAKKHAKVFVARLDGKGFGGEEGEEKAMEPAPA